MVNIIAVKYLRFPDCCANILGHALLIYRCTNFNYIKTKTPFFQSHMSHLTLYVCSEHVHVFTDGRERLGLRKGLSQVPTCALHGTVTVTPKPRVALEVHVEEVEADASPVVCGHTDHVHDARHDQ